MYQKGLIVTNHYMMVRTHRLIELRFYIPVDKKQVISEMFFPANLLA